MEKRRQTDKSFTKTITGANPFLILEAKATNLKIATIKRDKHFKIERRIIFFKIYTGQCCKNIF